jgi:hypothetical protein
MITFDTPPIKAALRKVRRKMRKVLPHGDWEIVGNTMFVRFHTLNDAVLFGKGKLPGVDHQGFEDLMERLHINCVSVIAGDKLLGQLVPK